MKFFDKAGLFLEALNSPAVQALRAKWRGATMNDAACAGLIGQVKAALAAHLRGKKLSSSEVDEIVGALVLVRHRQKPSRYAFAMKEQLTEAGDDPTGEWEKA